MGIGLKVFENIRIVLVNTSHPGNIGAAARAMKNMGFSHLYLISPESFPHQKATVRAAGADDILANATVVSSLEAAITGCDLVFATSARLRTLSWPMCNPRQCAEQIVNQPHRNVAVVFGRERSGLTNEELSHCCQHVYIPTAFDFTSLNLAAAVQVMVYEIHTRTLSDYEKPEFSETRSLATADQMNDCYQHLEQVLIKLEFLDPKQPKMLLQRLKRLFNRAQIDDTEISILRGILSAIDRRVH